MSADPRRRTGGGALRTVGYAGCSLAVSLTFFMGYQRDSGGDATFWLTLVGVNLALWSSWPRYRSFAIQQVTITLTLLVVANPVVSLLANTFLPARAERTPTQPPYLVSYSKVVGETIPGISGVQRFSTDGHGYRTNGPIDYAHKPANSLRVVAIGGSTTEEAFIDDRRTWTYLLAERLSKSLDRKVEMINTGVSSLRAKDHYQTFVESTDYSPDIAIFLMGINDWNQAIRQEYAASHPARSIGLRSMPLWSVIRRAKFDSSLLFGAIAILKNLTNRALDQWGVPLPVSINDGSYLRARNNSLARPEKFKVELRNVDGDYAYWVGRIMTVCRERRVECVFVDQPNAYSSDITPELQRRLWMTPNNVGYTASLDDVRHVADMYNAWLDKTAAARGFTSCPIAAKVPSTTEYLIDDCHYNEAGSRLVAQLIGDCIEHLRIGAR